MADISHDAAQEVCNRDGNLFKGISIEDIIKDFCKRCPEGTPTQLGGHKLWYINEEKWKRQLMPWNNLDSVKKISTKSKKLSEI